jgi:hypothetical protein
MRITRDAPFNTLTGHIGTSLPSLTVVLGHINAWHILAASVPDLLHSYDPSFGVEWINIDSATSLHAWWARFFPSLPEVTAKVQTTGGSDPHTS